MYKIIEEGVRRLSDSADIPNNQMNPDWRKYQEWLAKGNKPEPEFTEEELLVKEEAEKKQLHEIKIQERIREVAIDSLKAEGELPVDYS